MKGLKVNMISCVLLVVVLVLVIMYYMNKNNDGFKSGRRKFENKTANELRNKFMKR